MREKTLMKTQYIKNKKTEKKGWGVRGKGGKEGARTGREQEAEWGWKRRREGTSDVEAQMCRYNRRGGNSKSGE